MEVALFSLCGNENSKERGDPGKIYHVRNTAGRETLITCGQATEFAHALTE